MKKLIFSNTGVAVENGSEQGSELRVNTAMINAKTLEQAFESFSITLTEEQVKALIEVLTKE